MDAYSKKAHVSTEEGSLMIARHHVLRFSRLGTAFASKVGKRLLGYYSKSSGFLRRSKFVDEISSLI